MKGLRPGELARVIDVVDDERFPVGTMVTARNYVDGFVQQDLVEVYRTGKANLVESALSDALLERVSVLERQLAGDFPTRSKARVIEPPTDRPDLRGAIVTIEPMGGIDWESSPVIIVKPAAGPMVQIPAVQLFRL